MVGTIGVALTVGIRQAGALLSLLVLPLYVPALIFGSHAVIAAANQQPYQGQLLWLAALLALVGTVNIPIIHYSVVWWNTLHQPASIAKFAAPSIHISMLIPLLCMAAAFMLFYLYVLLINARSELLEQEKRSQWVRQLVASA